MSQFDTDKFCLPPDPDLVCCICQCVLHSPVESPCRHVFCNVCISTWLNNHGNCPTCRTRLRLRHLKPVLPLVQNMINRLMMNCDFKENGCVEQIMLELYLSHIENCGFKKVQCRFKSCSKMILKKEKDHHETETCEFREKLCMGRCGLMIPVCRYDNHDCYEELQRLSREKCELVDKLQETIKELNAQTAKLQKNIVRLKQLQQRRRDYLTTWVGYSSNDMSDNGSMYNFLPGSNSSSEDDVPNYYSQPNLMTPVTRPATTSANASTTSNGGFQEYIIYPRRRSTLQDTLPTHQIPPEPLTPRSPTMSPRHRFGSRSQRHVTIHPSLPSSATVTSADHALDLSYQAHVRLGSITSTNNSLSHPRSDSQVTSSTVTSSATSSMANQTEILTASSNQAERDINNHDSQRNDINEEGREEQNHSNGNGESEYYDSDSEQTPTRWWRSSRSTLSHYSEQHSTEHRSRSNSNASNRSRPSYQSSYYRSRSRSRSYSYESNWSYYNYRSRSRSRSPSYDRRSFNHDLYSDSYYTDRYRSRSYDSYRSDSRIPHENRRSVSSSRSRRQYWSRSRSPFSRSSSGSPWVINRSRSPMYSRSRSRSQSRNRSGSFDSVRSNHSFRSRSSGRRRSLSPDYGSSTPTRDQSYRGDRVSSSTPTNDRGHNSTSQNGTEHVHEENGENQGLDTSDDDTTGTDSDAEYNFKRRRRPICHNENVATSSSTTNSGSLSHSSPNQRKRKLSTNSSESDANAKRLCNNNEESQCDSDVSWVPSHQESDDDTITDDASSDSSYEVQVPKTVMEMIDEINSEESDETWSPSDHSDNE